MSTKTNEINVAIGSMRPGDVFVGYDTHDRKVTVRREVPAVEPGTGGWAKVRGLPQPLRVVRLYPNVQDGEGGYAWASCDLVDGKHKEVNGYDGTFLHTEDDVTDFVRDAPAPEFVGREVLGRWLFKLVHDDAERWEGHTPSTHDYYLSRADDVIGMFFPGGAS